MVRTTLFLVLAALGIVSQFAPVIAQDNLTTDPSLEENPAPSLKLGDLAPALNATRWLQGDPVRTFEPGKIYVVEFWATWCGPCIGNMPHLAELQAQYQDQGVTVISFTSRDIREVPGNTEEDVAAFVEKRGPTLRYTFAYADDGTTADAWLKAAGQKGFCTYVVDKAGRIAFMGHPMFLDLVLPKVVAGGASAKAVGDEMAEVMAEYETSYETLLRDFEAGRDLKAGLRALINFEARYPPLTDLPPIVQAKLSLLPKYGNPGEAQQYAEALVTKAIKQESVRLLGLAYSILRNETQSQEFLALAMRAAEAHVRIDGGKGAQSLLNLAEAYLARGDKDKAKEYAGRAIAAAAAESSTFQRHIEQEARKLGAEK